MRKKGNTMITAPIVFCITLLMIIMLSVFLINLIIPFVYYEKIDNIATKYIFVIEKFGYLTKKEKDSLLLELQEEGMSLSNIVINYPDKIKEYGTPIELNISYTHKFKTPQILNNILNLKAEETIISVRKNSFSKVY